MQFHRGGRKRLWHPVAGQLDLNFESMELPSEPGLILNVYTAVPDSPAADGQNDPDIAVDSHSA